MSTNRYFLTLRCLGFTSTNTRANDLLGRIRFVFAAQRIHTKWTPQVKNQGVNAHRTWWIGAEVRVYNFYNSVDF